MTTSRRTPRFLEEILQETLGANPRCRLLVLVNRNDSGGLKNTGEAIPCIFDCAEILVVSGDSISMVSEALAQRRPVVSFLPEPTAWFFRKPKYHRFLEHLHQEGRLKLVSPEKVGEAVGQGVNGNGTVSAHCPSDPIVEHLVKWL